MTIRAKRRSYFALGVIWVLLAASCVPLVYNNPGEGFELVVLITSAFAVTWWAWLLRVKLSLSNGYIEYREGIVKSIKLPVRRIAEIRDEKINWDALDKEPGVMVLNKNGDVSMLINPRPFKRDDLEKFLEILKSEIAKHVIRW